MAGRGRKTAAKSTKTLEQRLWDAADALRGNQEPSEYKHVVLGLAFLKYISDRFAERRALIEAELVDEGVPEDRHAEFLEDGDAYTAHNVFWAPADARWATIQDRAKLPSIGRDIDGSASLRRAKPWSPLIRRRRSAYVNVRASQRVCSFRMFCATSKQRDRATVRQAAWHRPADAQWTQ